MGRFGPNLCCTKVRQRSRTDKIYVFFAVLGGRAGEELAAADYAEAPVAPVMSWHYCVTINSLHAGVRVRGIASGKSLGRGGGGGSMLAAINAGGDAVQGGNGGSAKK